jgi:hypothetical protein
LCRFKSAIDNWQSAIFSTLFPLKGLNESFLPSPTQSFCTLFYSSSFNANQTADCAAARRSTSTTRASTPATRLQGGAAPPSEKRYNLNVSLYFQNLLNHVNLGRPEGNLSSPSFGESLGLGGSFGGFGGGGGGAGAGNRRIYAQVRLNF